MKKTYNIFKPVVLMVLQAFVCTVVLAQRTVYLDSNWLQVEDSVYATFKRVIEKESRKNYKVTQYFKDGAIAMTGSYHDVLDVSHLYSYLGSVYKRGTFVYYYKNGNVRSTGFYYKGCKDKEWKDYYQTGELKERVVYNFFITDSAFTYYKSGNLKSMRVRIKGEKPKCYEYEDVVDSKGVLKQEIKSDTSEIDAKPKPEYDVYQYIAEKTFYPPKLKKKGIQEKIYVRFIVDVNGHVTFVRPRYPYKHVEFMLEAIRVVSSFSDWSPGKIDGQQVSSYCTLPINFVLSDPIVPKKSEHSWKSQY